jgi:hypothetical protein
MNLTENVNGFERLVMSKFGMLLSIQAGSIFWQFKVIVILRRFRFDVGE